ncbi:MAG: hypothetical protein AAGB31_06175, partial [Bdellovibrio sp.]
YKAEGGFFTSEEKKRESAKKNMDYLLTDNSMDGKEAYTLDQKRSRFKEKLDEALVNSYTRSGEPTGENSRIVASGDADRGLENCLRDLSDRFHKSSLSDRETYDLCDSIASSCDLPDRVPRDPNNFCEQRGMALWPAENSKQLPPPPPPGGGSRSRHGTQ